MVFVVIEAELSEQFLATHNLDDSSVDEQQGAAEEDRDQQQLAIENQPQNDNESEQEAEDEKEERSEPYLQDPTAASQHACKAGKSKKMKI